MRDPVSTVDGQTYEREVIEMWLKDHNNAPLTNAPLEDKRLIPVIFVKKALQDFVDKKPERQDSRERYLPRSWIGELAHACQSGEEKEIRNLVRRDRRLLVHQFGEGQYRGKTALQLAALGHAQALDTVVNLLEQRQAGLGLAGLLEPDEKGLLPLHHAILAQKDAETILKLLAWMGGALGGVETPQGGWPLGFESRNLEAALLWCVTRKDLAKLRALLRLGASPHIKNVAGQSAVYLAVKVDFQEGLEALLQAGASPNLEEGALKVEDEIWDDTPLHCAVRHRNTEAAVLLKAYGADLSRGLRDGSPKCCTVSHRTLQLG